ncbi:hypothetical protein ACIQUM_07535 [Amycolatopsis azurea]|uniref:hypothetical protein n=1 Tax=Amycolatopsis azurea TaxID=36819 RepID=UPI003800C3E2
MSELDRDATTSAVNSATRQLGEPSADDDTLYDAIVTEADRRTPRALQHPETKHSVIEAAMVVIRRYGLVHPDVATTHADGELQMMGDFPYQQNPHRYCGSDPERESTGEPGHCEGCCSVGHLVAHPDAGCADVGCYVEHPDEPDAASAGSSLPRGRARRTLLGVAVPDHVMTFEVAPDEYTLWCFEHHPRIGSGRVQSAEAVGLFLRAHAHDGATSTPFSAHLAALADENGDARSTCPRCEWFAQAPVDATGVFLHQLADARLGHVAIAHPDLWEAWRGTEPEMDRGAIVRLHAEMLAMRSSLTDRMAGLHENIGHLRKELSQLTTTAAPAIGEARTTPGSIAADGNEAPATEVLMWAPMLERADRARYWYDAIGHEGRTAEQIETLVQKALDAEQAEFAAVLPDGCTWNPYTGDITGPMSCASALDTALEAGAGPWNSSCEDPEWPERRDTRVLSNALRAAAVRARRQLDECEWAGPGSSSRRKSVPSAGNRSRSEHEDDQHS